MADEDDNTETAPVLHEEKNTNLQINKRGKKDKQWERRNRFRKQPGKIVWRM